MSRHMPRLLSFLLLTALLLSMAAVPGAQAAGSAPADPMPPHPRLRDKIKSGSLKVPRESLAPEFGAARAAGEIAPAALAGPVKALAVLVDFSDNLHTVTASYFDSLIFALPVAGRGSVRDYYNEVSYGQVDIVSVNLPSALGWRRAPSTYATYVNNNNCLGAWPNNCQKLAEDIVDAINGVVNFSEYDNNHDGTMEPIMLIHAGRGAEYTGSKNDIWSHSWSLLFARNYDGVKISKYVIMPEYWAAVSATTSDMTIGVFAHEMGHGFWGVPDLYDTDYTSEGIGNWSLMAGGSWNGPLGASPAWPDAYTRIRMGFAAPTALAADANGRSIPWAGSAPTGTIFKLKNSALASSEYFLVENRQKTAGSYDEYLDGAGLAIWHVDEAKSGNAQECRSEPHSLCGATHYQVALEQADGRRDLEYGVNRGDAGDIFPGSANNRTWNGTTNPESSSWYSSAATNIAVTSIGNSAATMTANLLIGSGAALPAASINNVSLNEGNSGTIAANFTVSLSAPASGAASLAWATANGTASSSSDYVAAQGTVSFAAGESTKTVTVQVNGDTDVESNETFYVNLSNPAGATIADSQGLGTIVNDDQAPATTVHVGDLDGTKSVSKKGWTAKVTIAVHDSSERGVSGAVVSGNWGGSTVTCTTSSRGVCTLSKSSALTVLSVTFTVTGVTKTGATYNALSNHDPDGGTNGTTITINK